MSIHEDRAFQVGKSRVDLAGLRLQLARLKEDLSRFLARAPNGSVVAPLRERIRELEGRIAAADRARSRSRAEALPAAGEDDRDGVAVRSTTGRYPPRRR